MMPCFVPVNPGDLIDVVAPGFRPNDSELDQGIRFLESLGFRTRLPHHFFESDLLCSAQDSTRFQHLETALLAKDSKAIWCVRGGYGSLRLIPMLDQSKKLRQLKAKQSQMKQPIAKPLVGFSDVTSLQLWLKQNLNWPSLHGPMLERMGRLLNPSEALPHQVPARSEIEEVFRVLSGEQKTVVFEGLRALNKTAESLSKKKKSVDLEAIATGGNLETFASHIGTSLRLKTAGAVVVFEDWGERGYRIDRRLIQLAQSGTLNAKTKAIVFGDFLGGDDPGGGNKIWPVIERFAHEWGDANRVPIYSGLGLGHGQKCRVFPMGLKATLDPRSLSLSVKSGVRA